MQPARCPVCGFDNPAGVVACDDCGGVLPRFEACGTCGFYNASGSSFCGDCGSKIGSARPDVTFPAPAATQQAPAVASRAFALVHQGTGAEISLPWSEGELAVGRPGGEPDVDLAGFPDSQIVSRRHARLRVQGDRLSIEDLNSANGTYLNGLRLGSGEHALSNGDRLAFGQGNKVAFTVKL